MRKVSFFFAFIPALIFLAACNQKSETKHNSAHPVYDKVMATKTLRCGYAPWAPLFSIDANTKKMSGVFYDVAEEVAKRLSLRIEWTEEVGWGTAAESVKNGRIDAVCSGFWVSSTRARVVDFSTPITYSVTYVWVRGDAVYPYTSVDQLNTPEFSFGYLDGSADVKITQARFPKATGFSMPELTPISEIMAGLVGKKFDAVAYDQATVADYLKNNPGSLKKLFPDDPLAVYPTVMLLPAGESKLKAMIDNTIREIMYDGTMSTIVEKNGAAGIVKLPAKPYQD
jgi:ABC-type amino acid transport substrate-binding protein